VGNLTPAGATKKQLLERPKTRHTASFMMKNIVRVLGADQCDSRLYNAGAVRERVAAFLEML